MKLPFFSEDRQVDLQNISRFCEKMPVVLISVCYLPDLIILIQSVAQV